MGYEITPATIYLPAHLVPAVNVGADARYEQLSLARKTDGATTGPTNIGEAEARNEALVRKVKDCARRGDGYGLYEIFSESPEIVLNPCIADTVLAWVKKERFRRGRGRPWGSGRYHPLVIFGLVNRLLAVGTVHNLGNAFDWLDEHQGVDPSTAKRLYYQAVTEPRFRGLLFECPGRFPIPQDCDFARMLAKAKLVSPKEEIVWTASAPGFGSVEARFHGLEQGRNGNASRNVSDAPRRTR